MREGFKQIKHVWKNSRLGEKSALRELLRLMRLWSRNQKSFYSVETQGFYSTKESKGIDLIWHSPNLAFMNVIFPLIKLQLKGVKFEDFDELKYATRTIASLIDSRWYSSVFNSWLKKCEECIQYGGDYVEKYAKFRMALVQRRQTLKVRPTHAA